MRTEKKPKSKPKKCPLLKKHGLSANTVASLSNPRAIIICNQCPLQVCIFRRSGYVCADDRDILLKAEIKTDEHCPKCDASRWAFREDIGTPEEAIKCAICGYTAYHTAVPDRGKLKR